MSDAGSSSLLTLVPALRAELLALAATPLCVARVRLRRVDGVLAVLASRLLWTALTSPASASASASEAALVSVPLTAVKRTLLLLRACRDGSILSF